MMQEYFEFASRGKNEWWRYLASLVGACLLAALALIVLFTVLMVARLIPPKMAAELSQPKDPPLFFLGIIIVFGIFSASLAVAIAFIQGKRPVDVIGRWRWPLFWWGVGVWVVVQSALVLLDILIAPKGFSITANGGTASVAIAALIGLPVQTFAEEFVFRGYITQGLLLLLKRPLPTAVMSGLLFGLVHIFNGWSQALNAVVFGIVCSLIAIRTGGIALTWGLHLANNYFGAVVVVSASDVFKGSPGFIAQNTPQLAWWDLLLAVLSLTGLLCVALRAKFLAPANVFIATDLRPSQK